MEFVRKKGLKTLNLNREITEPDWSQIPPTFYSSNSPEKLNIKGQTDQQKSVHFPISGSVVNI